MNQSKSIQLTFTNQSFSIKTLMLCIIGLLITSDIIYAQVDKTSDLFKTLKINDSLLFSVGFNECDISQFEKFLAEDLEFYHDKNGIEKGKSTFINGIKSSLCNPSNNEKIHRYLAPESLEVFGLYDNGKLYGAIQKGAHYFSQIKDLTFDDSDNSAQFSHLWLLIDGKWKIKRVFSYNHISKPIKKRIQKITVSKNLLMTYVGNYRAQYSGNVQIKLVENNLFIEAEGIASTIIPIATNSFTHPKAPLVFEFIKSGYGKISEMIIKENGKIVEKAIKQ